MNDDLCINTLKRAGFSECATYIEGRLRQLSAAEDMNVMLKNLAETNGKLAHEALCGMREQEAEIQSLRDQIRNLDTRDGK